MRPYRVLAARAGRVLTVGALAFGPMAFGSTATSGLSPLTAAPAVAAPALAERAVAERASAAVRPRPFPDSVAPLPTPHGPARESVQDWRARADDAASLLVVVNKRRPLAPLTYEPTDLRAVDGVVLRAPAADAFAGLAAAAATAGVPVRARSGYRSYADQEATHAAWERALGAAAADAQSARAGHSEHQTGLAVDVMPVGGACQDFDCFAETPQAAWLADNAARFGFVVRYANGQEAVTGYTPEPWHLRYVGVEPASALAASGAASVEEYLGLPAAPTYADAG
ncbi:hypothetical protein GCM10007967_25630 [Xylanimonas ulmi]|uniref:D-Ala-D-Ala carboxypeptidase n=1 Tax=Xylanimonas ulmi TaxID=228973 RepID=A0A4Q7LZP2_9MICO|nr:D-Ala-D-Ala carboxypeptidase [Xylanibacterium ulmi]